MNERSGKRSRKRSRGRGGSPAGAKPADNRANGQKRTPPKVDPTEFWGDPTTLPERRDGLRHADDVTAVLGSLGRPPMTGHETAAEHWFSLVYERAGFLAGALAAAGGLDDPADVDD